MDRLDFGAIMEEDTWFENYDLSCPHCAGTGEQRKTTYSMVCQCGHKWAADVVTVDEPEAAQARFEEGSMDECPKCGRRAEYTDSSEKQGCDHCAEGQFEIMWNTAFSVNLRSGCDFAMQKLKAWDLGFCLIEHGDGHYLLMGSCGQDNTWLIHYTRYQLQGYLDIEDINECLGSGGHVFLDTGQLREICKYFRTRIPTPQQYADDYRRNMAQLKKIGERAVKHRKKPA